MVESTSKCDFPEGGRKMVNSLIESKPKCKRNQKRRKWINFLIEWKTKCKMDKRLGEWVNLLIEFNSKWEMGERRRKLSTFWLNEAPRCKCVSDWGSESILWLNPSTFVWAILIKVNEVSIPGSALTGWEKQTSNTIEVIEGGSISTCWLKA